MTSGDVPLCDLNPVAAGSRVASARLSWCRTPRYAAIPGRFLAVPLTSLEHHVEVPADDGTGLARVSYAMTEQVRAMSDRRAGRRLGQVSDETLRTIGRYLHLFIV